MNIDARNLANNNLTTTTNQNETRQLIRSLDHKPIDPAYLEPQVISPLEKAAIAGAPARTDSLNKIFFQTLEFLKRIHLFS